MSEKNNVSLSRQSVTHRENHRASPRGRKSTVTAGMLPKPAMTSLRIDSMQQGRRRSSSIASVSELDNSKRYSQTLSRDLYKQAEAKNLTLPRGSQMTTHKKEVHKNFSFPLLPEVFTAMLADKIGLVDMSRFRSLSLWHKQYAEGHLKRLWRRKLQQTYPVLALRSQLSVLSNLKEAINNRELWKQATIREYESDIEVVNPFDVTTVLQLYYHYSGLAQTGAIWSSMTNYCTLLALQMRIEFDGVVDAKSLKRLEEVIKMRYVDKNHKIVKFVVPQWENLDVNPEKNCLSGELKAFVLKKSPSFFLKLQYVMFVSRLPYFPDRIFEVRRVYKKRGKKVENLLMELNKDSIRIISETELNVLETYPFESLHSWTSHAELSAFAFKYKHRKSTKDLTELTFVTPFNTEISEGLKQLRADRMLQTSKLSVQLAPEKQMLVELVKQFFSESDSKHDAFTKQRKTVRMFNTEVVKMIDTVYRLIELRKTKTNFSLIIDLKRNLLEVCEKVLELNDVFKKAGKNLGDVAIFTQLSESLKAFAVAFGKCLGRDKNWVGEFEGVTRAFYEAL